jgi:DNA-directed RNA polymerase subunit RPC12/RpoP
MISVFIGFAGVAGLGLLAMVSHQPWFYVLAVFILLNCWRGLMHARILAKLAKLPRRHGYACPACGQPPVLGAFWRCARCLKPFDTFETQGRCPHCQSEFAVTQCLDCGEAYPFPQWIAQAR